MAVLMRLLFILGVLGLSACGTINATMPNKAGEPVMLLGHDPVAYFKQARAVRGDPAIKSSLPDRTYYFINAEHKRLFDANPQAYEPQYGGFCASGAAFGLKLGSDPTEWRIREGRLYIFGDIMGRTAWEIDPDWNIAQARRIWPEAEGRGWRIQTLWRFINKVDWYKDSAQIRRDFEAKHPGRPYPSFDVGSLFANLFSKQPGWRAREGHGGQPVVGLVGEDPCPVACTGAPSQAFGEPASR